MYYNLEQQENRKEKRGKELFRKLVWHLVLGGVAVMSFRSSPY
jgi:hypothetical protein